VVIDYSTTSEIPDSPAGRQSRWATNIGLLLLAAVVAAGALGFLGLRTETVEVVSGDYRLEVKYASITRAGEPSPLDIRVEHSGGFPGPIQLSLCDGYFDHLDFQSWYPTPSAETGTPRTLDYEFDPPTGDLLEISLDARTAPGQFGGRETCTITLLDRDKPVTSVTISTWRLP
jgi:hypothetical protein